MQANRLPKENDLNRLISFINAQGPEENEYGELTNLWDTLNLDEDGTASNVSARDRLILLFGDDFLNQTMQ